MTQFLNLVLGLNGPKVFVLVVDLSLPHWWHWVKTLLIVETIYLLNFVGWACVALVPTKWQIFNSNKLEIVSLTRDVLSPVKWNTWSIRCKTHFPNYSSWRMFHFETQTNRDRKMNFKNLFQNGTNAHKLQLKRSLEMDWNYFQG